MRIEIGFGVGFDAAGKPITPHERDERLKLVLTEAALEFGGCNILSGQGAWINDAGTLVAEESRTLVIETPSGSEQVHKARRLAEYVRRVFQQEAVIFSISRSTSKMVRGESRVPTIPEYEHPQI